MDSAKSPASSPHLEASPIPVPKTFRRSGQHGFTWNIPRTFPGYFADTNKQVIGNATKYVIRTENLTDPQYLIKYAQKHGERETYTEFFLNQFGNMLGLQMAHSGLVVADGRLAFLSGIFTGPEESLRHGSLIIEDYYKDEKALEKIKRQEEQAFYSIDFVASHLRAFCGSDFATVFPKFVEMLVFDALIGSMDRHAQNWGVVGRIVEPTNYRFSPIFDTARALLWSADEEMVSKMLTNDRMLVAFIDRARPCLGPERTHVKVNSCNHFDFVENLMKLYPHQTEHALIKVTDRAAQKSAKLLSRFPFDTVFSGDRKRLITRILNIRAARLEQILVKGGAHDRQTLAVPV